MEAEETTKSLGAHALLSEASSVAVEEYLQLTRGSIRLGDNAHHNRPQSHVALFRGICVWGGNAELDYLDTVASVFTLPGRIAKKLFSQKKPKTKTIIQSIDGIVKEGEMLLVLGRPGSGATTLLKTLAGMTETYHGWKGEV